MTHTDDLRAAALNGVAIATQQHRAIRADADRTLAYYLRTAIAHGLTVDEVCQVGELDRDQVIELTDPAGAC